MRQDAILGPACGTPIPCSTSTNGAAFMAIDTRRRCFGKLAKTMSAVAGARILFAQQPPAGGAPSTATAADRPRGNNHIRDGVYYFSGTGSNDGYGREDHVLVTDPFEKHVTRTMDALKKSLERAGCTMDSIIHLEVFICLPHADSIPMPTGKARFDAHKAQYDALNKIYNTDRKSTRLNSSHLGISYAVFCLKKKNKSQMITDGPRSYYAYSDRAYRRVSV